MSARRLLVLLPILVAYVLASVAKINWPDAIDDEWRYLHYANNLTHGVYAEPHSMSPDLYLWHGPALPGLLAPFVALHAPLTLTRIVLGPLLLFAAILVFHELVRMYLPPSPALIATYALAAYLPFATVLYSVHVEPLATLCFTAAVFFLLRAYRGNARAAARAGAALGVLALSRVEYGWVVLVALALSLVWWALARRSSFARASVVAAAVAFAVCTPWLAYTYSKSHKVPYWGNSGGLSLYWMTATGGQGEWHGFAEPLRNPALAASRPLFVSLRGDGPVDADARLQHAASDNIRAAPGRFVVHIGANLGRIFVDVPYGSAPDGVGALLYAVPNLLLLLLLAAALLAAWRARANLPPELGPVAALTLLAFAVHVPVSAFPRLLIPLVPAAVALAVAALAGRPAQHPR